jgi:hypothetical protein
MALTIGFTNKYFTLWDVETREEHIDENTNRVGMYASYIKNISFKREVATSTYPDADIDEGLRGKTSSFWVNSKIVIKNPTLFTFGKYKGQDAKDVAKFDVEYVLWASSSAYSDVQRQAMSEIPEVVSYLENRKEKLKQIQLICDGEQIEITIEGGFWLANGSKFVARISTPFQDENLWLQLVVDDNQLHTVSTYYGTSVFLIVNGKNKRTKGLRLTGTARIESVEEANNNRSVIQRIRLEDFKLIK